MSGVVDGNLKAEKIEETAKAVDTLFRQLKLLDPQFIVIVSSTAFNSTINNLTALENAIRDITGHPVQHITKEEEIYYGLLSCVPQKRIGGSILIDIGSGNTKLGYSTPMSASGFESVVLKYGTVTLKEAAMVTGNFRDNLTLLYSSNMGAVLRKEVQNKPGLANLNRRIYIVGGASWAAANMIKPQDIDKQYVTLKLAEIITLNRQLLERTYTTPNNLNPKSEKTISSIMDVFTPEDLQSGTTILASILADLGGDKRKIIFPREGGWVIGYMFAQYNDLNK